MTSSKLIFFLRQLDEKEMKSLKKFIHSPYFNTKKKLRDFFDYLYLLYPEFPQQQLDKKWVWQKLSPGKEINVKKMTDLMSEMTILVQKFLTMEAIQNDEKLFRSVTILAFREKNIVNFFVDEISKVEQIIDSKKELTSTNQLLRYLLKKENYYHPLTSKNPPAGELLEVANKHLEHFFLSSKLKLVLEMKNRNRVFSESLNVSLDSLNEVYDLENHVDPLVKTYYNIILFHERGDLSLLPMINSLLMKYMSSFFKEDKIIILHSLINQISYVYHSGVPILVHELLKYFKQGLNEQIFISANKMKHTTFLNITVTGAAAADFQFLDTFIETYQSFILEKVRSDTIALSEIYRTFHKKQFEQTVEMISQLNYTKLPEFEYRMRNLEIRCYFEMHLHDISYQELLTSRLQSFTKYLSRNETLSKNRTKSYQNFSRITKKIMRAIKNNKLTDRKIYLLKKELQECNPIVSYNWLLAKIEGDHPKMPPS